jgi:hypothetical protein
MMKRYASKLLFQFRVVVAGKSSSQRTVEDRIVLINATSARAALAKARRIGKQREYDYTNNDGNRVYVELVGVTDLVSLDPECLKDEVWYDIRTMMRPMERKRQLVPKDADLSAINLESQRS